MVKKKKHRDALSTWFTRIADIGYLQHEVRHVELCELWQNIANWFEVALHSEIEGILAFG
jgi:hypothetical protein